MNRALFGLATVGRLFTNRYNILAKVKLARAVQPVYLSSLKTRFLDNENFNAHSTMKDDPMYSETVANTIVLENCPVVTDKQFHFLINQDFHSKTANEICDDFSKISVYIIGKDFNLMDSIFTKLRKQLIVKLPEMTDEQLISIFKLIPLWNVKNAKDPDYFTLWLAFDKQCIARYKKWSLNKLLLFMDYWYLMKLSRLSNFVWIGLKKLARKPSRLTPKQLVHMMFFANTSRKYLVPLSMYDIEQEIITYYNDFNVKELGIVSLGFFKTQTPIRNQDLVNNLYKTVIQNIDNLNSLNLAAFLKIFRYCTKHRNADYMYRLMDVLTAKVDEVELVCCIHMALLGTNLLIKHEGLLKKISQKVVNELPQARAKDLERITLVLTMFNYNPKTTPCIFESIVNELRSDSRRNDYEEHLKCYSFTLAYLALHNIFPYDCISKCLNTETLHKCFGKKLSKFNVPRDVVTLNNSVLIECPDYSGPLLPDTLKNSCNEHMAWYIPQLSTLTNENVNDKGFIKLHRELLKLFSNESYLHVCYPLPHHPKSNIIFCINAEGKPVTIPIKMKSKTVFNDFQKPPEIGNWFAIMVLVRNSVLYYSNEYNGLTLCKIRQLKKLGYEPIALTPKELEYEKNIQNIILEKLKNHGTTLRL